MHAVLNIFPAKPGMRDRMENLADQTVPELRSLKGFKGITFFLDPETDQYGGFALWETKDDAEAALAGLRNQVEETLSDLLVAPPTQRLLEVYEPK